MFVRDVDNLNFGQNPALFLTKKQPKIVGGEKQQSDAANEDGSVEDDNSGGLIDLCDYPQKHQLAINLEQKMYFIINDHLKNSQTYQNKIENILSGYMDTDLHTALINYILVLKIDKMTKHEVEIILSKLFQKTEETRSLSRYIQTLKDTDQLKCLKPEN